MGHRRLTFTTGRSLHPPHDVIQVGFFQLDNLRDLLTALWLSTKVAFIGLAIAIALGQAVKRHLQGERWDPLLTTASPPCCGQPLERRGCSPGRRRVEAITGDPPAYLTGALGPYQTKKNGRETGRAG
jgi:hypothetical protein